MTDADVIVIGAGLAGLVAAVEAADAGKRVIILDQEPRRNLGGQAFWSFGGLFLVNSPEQRRLGVRDSLDLAWSDWLATAGFDRVEDDWARRWARAYVEFAAGEKRAWMHAMGWRAFPVVGWAERGHPPAAGRGNSVPRFHVTWGTGPGLVEPFARRAQAAERDGRIVFRFRHRVDELIATNGVVEGARGAVLAPSGVERGASSNRTVTGDFELRAGAVIVASGGIGGNHDMVRKAWPERLGTPPTFMLSGVPAHVDGRMLGIAEAAGGRLINGDRMWHYVEGLRNWAPIWPRHGIRILPGPSSLWLDARGERLPAPHYPGYDTLGALEYLRKTGCDHSWFILTQSIIRKEFALSGSEQNPDLTGKSWGLTARRAFGKRATGPVEAFKDRGADFVIGGDVEAMVGAMNALTDRPMLKAEQVRAVIEARDAALGSDPQMDGVRTARRYVGDRLIRTAKPHRLLDPSHGPLIAVKLNILTRKSLGGLQTDLSARVLGADGQPVPGLYAAGEAAGFGGGGLHGYGALEGAFLGGCLFSGRIAGRSV